MKRSLKRYFSGGLPNFDSNTEQEKKYHSEKKTFLGSFELSLLLAQWLAQGKNLLMRDVP